MNARTQHSREGLETLNITKVTNHKVFVSTIHTNTRTHTSTQFMITLNLYFIFFFLLDYYLIFFNFSFCLFTLPVCFYRTMLSINHLTFHHHGATVLELLLDLIFRSSFGSYYVLKFYVSVQVMHEKNFCDYTWMFSKYCHFLLREDANMLYEESSMNRYR